MLGGTGSNRDTPPSPLPLPPPVAPQLMDFYQSLGGVQRDAMWWAYQVVQNTYRLQAAEYRAWWVGRSSLSFLPVFSSPIVCFSSPFSSSPPAQHFTSVSLQHS